MIQFGMFGWKAAGRNRFQAANRYGIISATITSLITIQFIKKSGFNWQMINREKDQDIVNKEIEIIPGRLYFCCTNKKASKNGQSDFQFNVDDVLEYVAFHNDIGPLKLSCVYQYIDQLTLISQDPDNSGKKFWHITSTEPKKYTNSILLVCAYMVVAQKKCPEEAYRPFEKFKIIGFRDSSSGNCSYEIQILDCLKGLARAVALNWFNMSSFSVDDYQKNESTQNGDINEIVKDKVYALSLPPEEEKNRFGKKYMTSPELAKNLKNLNITVVIQLTENDKFSKAIRSEKIANYCLFFPEYGCPETEVVEKFLQIISKYDKKTKFAVVCKTGLGKTGTMIGCHVIKEYHFSAPEYMGWARLCRPGSVIGPQQEFLVEYDKKVNKQVRANEIAQSTEKKTNLVRRNSHSNYESKSQAQENSLKRSERLTKKSSFGESEKKEQDIPQVVAVVKNKKNTSFDIENFFKALGKN